MLNFRYQSALPANPRLLLPTKAHSPKKRIDEGALGFVAAANLLE